MDLKFNAIRPFHDSEINQAILSILDEPMLKSIMNFTFPTMSDEEWKKTLREVRSTDEFQKNIIYKTLQNVLKISSDGLTTSGFEKLEPNTSYLFISNHRDIILDTSLLNFTLCDHDLLLTASAIGDNLVKKPFLNILAKINRNFLVLRDLPPRELLESSILLSEYIEKMLSEEKRSVWIAQREGRTKDGNDATHSGVLKMLSFAAGKENVITFFKKLKIVPVSISYQYDPTDALKLPELIASMNNQAYIKGENEDFNSIYNGIIGQKKGIHIHAGNVLDTELEEAEQLNISNKQIKALAQIIDKEIISNYRLWSSNYIAYDLLYHADKYAAHYSAEEKTAFQERLYTKIDSNNSVHNHQFLAMYANPVVNKEQYL
jgi:1-acyl-sn-glycerol-3-phosphate acyltransferase